MKREEEIKILKGLQDSDYPKYSEALETAIRSLEAWDRVKEDIGKIREYYIQGARGNRKGFLYGLNVAMYVINEHLEDKDGNEDTQ